MAIYVLNSNSQQNITHGIYFHRQRKKSLCYSNKIKMDGSVDGNWEQEQEDEIVALKAIFAEDFQDVSYAEMPFTRHFSLRIVPHTGDPDHNFVECLLVVGFSERYPRTRCHTTVKTVKGPDGTDTPKNLSATQIEELKKIIHDETEALQPEQSVMVHQLACLAQDFLRQHNTPPLSLAEEREERQQQEKLAQKAEQDKVDAKAAQELEAKVIFFAAFYDRVSLSRFMTIALSHQPLTLILHPHHRRTSFF